MSADTKDDATMEHADEDTIELHVEELPDLQAGEDDQGEDLMDELDLQSSDRLSQCSSLDLCDHCGELSGICFCDEWQRPTEYNSADELDRFFHESVYEKY